MANKMISEDDLRDDFISAMVRSDKPLKAPEGLLDGIMNQIGPIPAATAIKPYNPPLWLKWGIPATIISLMLVLLVWGNENNTAQQAKGPSLFDKAFNSINSWFSGLHLNINLPNSNLSSTITWIIGGGILLTWGFLLLARFLDKKVHN